MIDKYEAELVKKGAKSVHADIAMIIIFERLHRSYEEYINTPATVIDLILQKFSIDDKHSANG